MMQIDKNTFSVYTVEKNFGSSSAPKTTFYADFKICLVLEGEAVWEIEDNSFSVRAGDIVFLNLGQKRRFVSFGKDGFKLCALVLGRNAFASVSHFDFFLERVKNGQNLIRNENLFAILKEVYEETKENIPLSYSLVSAKITEFFIKAERETGYAYRPLTHTDMEMLEVMNYIDGNVTEGISLGKAAKRAGMSESAFSRRFVAMNGISFKRYVMEKKTQKAVHLLNTTDLKMIDVALGSGFESVSGFYEAFKKITGTTPKKLKMRKGDKIYETEV